MSLTMDIGRWADIRTAKTYVNTALLDLTSMTSFDTDTIRCASNAFLLVLGQYQSEVTA